MKLNTEQKEKLATHYEAFLRAKLARAKYESVFSRIHGKDLAAVIGVLVKAVLATSEPVLDAEFMERVGNQALRIRDEAA